MSDALILMVFVKAPSPGQVKTRLLPVLSPEQAASVYRCLVQDTLTVVTRLRRIQVVVAYAPDSQFPDLTWLRPHPRTVVQQGPTLGDRLVHAFDWAFTHGGRRVVVLGSDAPDLSTRWLQQAFEALSRCDVVLGPATDGGYHLIGLTRPQPKLFTEMPWSRPSLLAKTLERIRHLPLTVHCLTPIADVDTPEDLHRYVASACFSSGRTHTARFLSRHVHVLQQQAVHPASFATHPEPEGAVLVGGPHGSR